MEITGIVAAVLPIQKGEGARGPWAIQEFVVEVPGQYPKRTCISIFGEERINRFNVQPGQTVQVYFDIDAHEYKDRWFNEIRAYDVRPYQLRP